MFLAAEKRKKKKEKSNNTPSFQNPSHSSSCTNLLFLRQITAISICSPARPRPRQLQCLHECSTTINHARHASRSIQPSRRPRNSPTTARCPYEPSSPPSTSSSSSSPPSRAVTTSESLSGPGRHQLGRRLRPLLRRPAIAILSQHGRALISPADESAAATYANELTIHL